MASRRTPPRWLTEAWIDSAARSRRDRAAGEELCWLAQFDVFAEPCTERLQGIHILSRQRIRNILRPLLIGANEGLESTATGPPAFTTAEVDDLIELIEWDGRNASAGCTNHHPRFDSQRGPELVVPYCSLTQPMLSFVDDYGFEVEAERKFSGQRW